MGIFFTKPYMIDVSTDTDDLFPSEMEQAILIGDIEKVKQIKSFNVIDSIFLAAKTNQIEILKQLRKNLQIPRLDKKLILNENENSNMC